MKKSTVIILWGVITGIVNDIFYQILNMTGNMEGSLHYISWLIVFGGLLVGTLQYRKANDGFASFGECYKAGILMTLIISVLGTAGFAFFLFGHPDFVSHLIEQQRAAYVNRGMTSDQIDKAMSMAKNFMTPPVLIVFSFIGEIITGAIMSLLSSGIVARKKPLVHEEEVTIQ
jgi:hypothetical protein